jgi:F-type H+-transporting ATPase subunit gamma
MPTLIDFRRRIRSVKNTQQITRAMKFVSAAKLRKAQEALLAQRPYARGIQRVLRSALSRIENPSHPLLVRRPEERVLVLVLTGDRALCGAFNSNVVRLSLEFLRPRAALKRDVIAIGRKGNDALVKNGISPIAQYLGVSSKVDFAVAKDIAGRIAAIYAECHVDAVYAVYNEFKSVLVQNLRTEKLLPFDPETLPGREESRATEVDYIYAQPPAELFAGLVPRCLEAEVFRILLESATAEHGARMAAMDSATSNARDLIDHLTLEMNKIRQACITKELIEIVSGAASAVS